MRYPERSVSAVPLVLEVGASQESVAARLSLPTLEGPLEVAELGPGSSHPEMSDAMAIPRPKSTSVRLKANPPADGPAMRPALHPMERKRCAAQAKPRSRASHTARLVPAVEETSKSGS